MENYVILGLILVLIGSATGLTVSTEVDLSFDNFDMSFSPSLVFSSIEVKQDRLVLDGNSLYENSETNHDLSLEHYNSSLRETMRLNYLSSGNSELVWDVSGLYESDEDLFVKDENGNLVVRRQDFSGEESFALEPESSNSEFSFYFASGDLEISWEHEGNVTGFRVYRNNTANPSDDVSSLDWSRVVDTSSDDYSSESGDMLVYNKSDIVEPGIKYCYRVTSYNEAGESIPKPDDIEGACIVP
jgi:hypothetical protein